MSGKNAKCHIVTVINIFSSMDAMKKKVRLPSATGKEHSSLGLNLFFPRMLLGASLVPRRGRLKKKKKTEKERKTSLNLKEEKPRNLYMLRRNTQC